MNPGKNNYSVYEILYFDYIGLYRLFGRARGFIDESIQFNSKVDVSYAANSAVKLSSTPEHSRSGANRHVANAVQQAVVLIAMGDLAGYRVVYRANERESLQAVELTMISQSGKLIR